MLHELFTCIPLPAMFSVMSKCLNDCNDSRNCHEMALLNLYTVHTLHSPFFCILRPNTCQSHIYYRLSSKFILKKKIL